NEQMLGWPVAPNAAALLRRIHLRKELLHTCEHESIEGTFRHCIASASVAAAAVKPKAIRSVFMTSLVLAHQMRAPVTHKRARGSCTERPARPAHRDAYPLGGSLCASFGHSFSTRPSGLAAPEDQPDPGDQEVLAHRRVRLDPGDQEVLAHRRVRLGPGD